jgi:hypothetical protein
VALALNSDSEEHDDDMLANQRAHFEKEANAQHEECVVTETATSCFSVEPVDGPDFFAPPQVEEERRRRSPGLQNNFYDISNADFRKPFDASAGARSMGSAAQSPAGAADSAPQSDAVSKAEADTTNDAPPPQVGEARRARSPGLQNNFYDVSNSDFKKPYDAKHQDVAPAGSSGEGGDGGGLLAKVAELERSNERLEAALAEARAKETALMRQLTALEMQSVEMRELAALKKMPARQQWPVWSRELR